MHENSVIKTIAVLTVRFDNYIEIDTIFVCTAHIIVDQSI